ITPTATTTPTATATITGILPVTATITPLGGEIIYGQLGKGALTLNFPADAFDKTANISVTALTKLPAELPQDVWYKSYGVDVQINSTVDGAKVEQTSLPVTITLQYAGLPIDFGNETSQKLLALYHYNETQQTWERLWTT